VLLSREPGIEVAGEAASAPQAVDEALKLLPDVVLMDMRLPGGSGLEAGRDILSSAPLIKVLFLTSYADEEAAVATMLAGAAGFLLKDIGHAALVQAIRDAAAGRPVLDWAAAQRARERVSELERPAGTWRDTLSPQERKVLQLVVQGKTNREIGAALGLSEKTVKNYLSNVFQKLGVTRRAEAAALFARGERS
jgi:RNA polymerase sigma factor (sigma-70 family)